MVNTPPVLGLTTSQQQALEMLIPLTEEERLNARERARKNVIRSFGTRPTRDQLKDYAASDYPPISVGLMLVIVFAAAASRRSNAVRRLPLHYSSATAAERLR